MHPITTSTLTYFISQHPSHLAMTVTTIFVTISIFDFISFLYSQHVWQKDDSIVLHRFHQEPQVLSTPA